MENSKGRFLQIKFRDPDIHRYVSIPVDDNYEIRITGEWLTVPGGFVRTSEILSARIAIENIPTKGDL